MKTMTLAGFTFVVLMSIGIISCTGDSGSSDLDGAAGTHANRDANTGTEAGTGTDSGTGSGNPTDADADGDANTTNTTNTANTANAGGATNTGGAQLSQYTPDQANWDTFATKPFEGGTNTSHEPDGVGWISADDWAAAEWDGTVYNPSQMTPGEFAAAICPSVDRIRGIREVFYQHNPFADNESPTKAEVDEWHRIAINHLRALVGYTGEDRQVKKDRCMFARALWGDERKFTSIWDAEYPGTLGSAAGPCLGSANAHCGATFIPELDDQAPYLPDGHAGCSTAQGAEGVFGGPKSNIPWSLKWSRGLCNTLMAEGFWGGHVGPWFHREKFGLSFWDGDPSNGNNNAVLRAKWTGKLMPSLYCNPAEPDCDPDSTGP